MPRDPTITDIQLSNIIACLMPAIDMLTELHDGFGSPFVQAISNTTQSLISMVQVVNLSPPPLHFSDSIFKNVKRNRDECIRCMENIHELICAIVHLHMQSEPVGSLSPEMLDNVGKFMKTLHKIHAFIEAQQDSNKIKQFLRQIEMNALLKECQAGLQEALDIFKVECGVMLLADVMSVQKKTEKMHQELLELISEFSDEMISDRASSIYHSSGGSGNSSNSFSMLPSKPKIFHGREEELQAIVDKISQGQTKIAILGTGGMGKTSLARAALHHPDIETKYEHKFFITADSATTSIELAALVGSHLGLKPGKDLTKAVIQHLSRCPPCLMVLDNLETCWEPLQSRSLVEEFLSLLTDLTHLALIITMRGAERPAKVCWTRPFLEPLKPLSDDAARQTFIEIADDFHDSRDVDKLLQLTDNMPLAVDLIAHQVDYEGCSKILTLWETEKTSLLSVGHDKTSSLDASIRISLSSPRITSCPGAKDLLSLLSILPDGLSDVELQTCKLPIQNILECRAILLGTALAYYDDKNRLRSLVPIREHMLLDLHYKYHGLQLNSTRVSQIIANVGNLQQLLLLELQPGNPDIVDAISCTISLSVFRRLTGHGHTTLMDHVPSVFPQPSDHHMEAKFTTELLALRLLCPMVDPEALIAQGMTHFNHIDDPALESDFYRVVGGYHYAKTEMASSRTSYRQALSLAKLCGSKIHELNALNYLAILECTIGQLPAAQTLAHEAQQLAQESGNLFHEALTLKTQLICLISRTRELLCLCGLEGSGMDCGVMNDMAEIHQLKSEYEEARKIHLSILQTVIGQKDPQRTADSVLNIGAINIMIGLDLINVQQSLDEAKKAFTASRLLSGVIRCDAVLADLHLTEANPLAAKKLFQECLDQVWGRDHDTVSYCLERLADVGRWTSTNINWPYTWTVIYLLQSQKNHTKLALYKALRFMGDIFLAEGDEETAKSLFIVALQGFTFIDVHRSRADCLLRLGDIEQQRGNLLKAKQLWQVARPLFARSLQVKDIARIDTKLGSLDQDIITTHQKVLPHLSKLHVPTTSLDGPSIGEDPSMWVIEPKNTVTKTAVVGQ
ncbi:hypothetical protein C8R44DRAFT_745667 [Mycena epipterygia]|nr:hypothetical protein C8R44DRAFT_745667 [Mycena epipterygia]